MMKYCTVLGLSLIALTVLIGGAFAQAETPHAGKAMVLKVDGAAGRIVMTEEPRGTHVLLLNSHTKVINEVGSPIPATALQPGDTVREECFDAGNGIFAAKLIRLLRPAWMDLASPEM